MEYLIYGAYGYTGKLVLEEALSKGHKPMIAGRDPEKTKALADQYELEFRVIDLADTKSLHEAVESVDLVLHCAGPFSQTAKPMIEACLAKGAHYLDITGEIEVFELAASLGQQAKDAGVILMPGVGFDVVPSDCLASHLKQQMPEATHLELAFVGESSTSRGTALTMAESMSKSGAVRKEGEIIAVPHAYKSRKLNLDGKEKTFVSIPWGDVSTAFYSTEIPNIIVYTGMHPKQIKKLKKMQKFRWLLKMGFVKRMIESKIRKNVTGPSKEMRDKSKTYLWGEVTDDRGNTISATLTTLEGYKLTAITSVKCVERVLKGRIFPGFKTPSMACGPDFIMEVDGTTRS